MKLKSIMAACASVLFAVSSFADGTVTFGNTPTSAVIDATTGQRVAVGVAIAGLYFNENLSATPDLTVPDDGWTLAATTVISPNALFSGVYSGGTVTITSTAGEADPVLFQVRAWSVGFDTYADALTLGSAATLVGGSNVGQLQLGGPNRPASSTSTFVQGFDITPVPEPSTVVLGLLGGLGAMVLLRRRK